MSSFILSSEIGGIGALASPIVEDFGDQRYGLLCSKKACIIVPPNAKTPVHGRQKLSQLETRGR